MKKLSLFVMSIFFLLVPLILLAQETDTEVTERRISVSEYRNKMKAGWIGQMVGVGWGAPTEFRYMNRIIPKDEVPEWMPKMVNVWGQDDLYVEMTFLRTLEIYGLDVSMHQAGIDFANSKYMLWHANEAGRSNLRNGIAPPDCSHPQFNEHADDIDYQIEADFSGLIAPGLPNTVIALGEKFGRLMNYGDVRDVIHWHKENPDDWKETWQLVNEKYHENPDYRRLSCSEAANNDFNIDAKINGAYIVMGLLYGNSDPDMTTVISMRCGQDSDCNPSNAAGILFTTISYDSLPDKYISALELDKKFSYTEYNFQMLSDVCVKLAAEIVVKAGGRIEKNDLGEEVFIIPVLEPRPSVLEKSWDPGPIAGTTFTNEDFPHLKWQWISKLVVWLLLALALIVLKENRNIKSLWLLIPLVVPYLLWELLSGLIPAKMLGVEKVYVVSLGMGISLLF
jgi:hypothetical protein